MYQTYYMKQRQQAKSKRQQRKILDGAATTVFVIIALIGFGLLTTINVPIGICR